MQGSLENVERVTNRAALGRVFVYTYVQTQYIDTIVDNLHDGFLYAIISTAAAKSAGDATDDIAAKCMSYRVGLISSLGTCYHLTLNT